MMSYKDKQKDQLIDESIRLRQRISDLEASRTDRKRTDEHFWKGQEPFVGIYKYSKDGMAYASMEGVLLDVNDSFLRLTGYSREELLDAKKYQDITPDEYHDYEAGMVEHALKTGELVQYEKEYKKKDGSRVPVLLTVFILKSTDGKPIALAAIIKNLAKRRGIYEKSQKQEAKLKALYKDLNKRNRDLEILNTITQAVHQYVNLEEIYEVALDMTIALENVDMAMIYLVDDERKKATIQAHRNIPDQYIRRAGVIPYPKGITWKVIDSGEKLNVPDVQYDSDIGPAGRDLGAHGVLGIPITLYDRAIGVIWLFSNKERRFDEQEVALLSSIGNQIAVAIAKANLYRDLSRKKRYEEIVSFVTQSVHESINLQEVIENAVKSMSENLDRADTIAIYLIEGNEAVLKAHRGLTNQYIKRAGRILYPTGATWRAIIESNPIYCEDVELDKVLGLAGRKMGMKSYLCTPIQFLGKPVGSLNITSFSKNAFDKEELKLLSTVARQIETAINNATQAEALRNSEERYRALYEDNPSMYFTVNSEGKIVSVNEFGAQQLGYTAKELVGQSVVMVFHLDDQEKVREQIAGCRQNPKLTVQWESRKITKDGRNLWVREVGRSVRGADGNIITLIVCEDITELKQAEEELRTSHEQLRALAARLQSVREEERSIIAREVHDELGQALTGLKMNLSWLDKRLSELGNMVARPLRTRIESMSNVADTTIQRVREISSQLRPGVLDDLGLTAAIEWQTQEFQSQMGIRCKFNANSEHITLDSDKSTAIFRIFQETLTNVARHSKATGVSISLMRMANNLSLKVTDNGKGIEEDKISSPKSLGLLGMRERARLLGGNFKITSTLGKGTKVTLQVPLSN